MFVCVIGNDGVVSLDVARSTAEFWTQLFNPLILRHLTIIAIVNVVRVHNPNIFNLVTFFQSLCSIVKLSHLGRTFQDLSIVSDSAALLLHCASDIRPSFTLIVHMSPLNTACLVPQLYLLILQGELTSMYGYMSIIIIAQCLLAMIHLIT